jgi:hypothetical protein
LKPTVSPSQYNIKEELVKQTRFSKILAGGTMPKDGLIIDKNPGVGDYEQNNTLIDKIMSKSPRTSSFFASTHGKSYYQGGSLTPGVGLSPRACAFGMPNTHENINQHGFIKGFSPQYKQKETMQTIESVTKCVGA